MTLDNKSAEIAAASEIAGILRKLTQSSMLCARLEQNLYLIAGIGDGETMIPLLQERMTAMLLHSQNCFALYGLDSFCMASVQTAYESSTALQNAAEQALADEIQKLQKMRQKEQYAKLIPARVQLYRSDDETPTVEQLCRQFLISAGHFRKIYKETFGIAFHQDEIRKRMLQMIFLLMTTTLDLSAIVSKCGYEDYGYCLRLFRQFTGYTPNQYRKMF
jgi:AraC-like DNA-binding protein